MGLFDRLRYGIALFLVVFAPASVAFWIVVHPLARFWRRVGTWWGYAAGIGLSTAIAVACYRTRGWIAATDLGKYMFTTGTGLALLVLAGVFRRHLQKQLRSRILLGLPELAPDTHPGRLLTDGVYAHMRHPRYVQMLLAILGWALLSNYVAGYVALLVTMAAVAVVIPLEERELAERFGAAYEAYRRRVPALIPRWGASRQHGPGDAAHP
jgi:protein-S-isoprenylcysteine O-methyltransferase Ste14